MIRKIKKVFGKIRERMRKNPSLGMRIFLGIMAGGYVFFFTSALWYPETQELVQATPYYKSMSYLNYNMYLTQCVYSKKDAAIQIIVELNNRDVKDKELEYEAVERSSGKLDIEPVFSDPNYVVLRIKDVPVLWKEISIRVQEKGEDRQAKIYTNINEIKKVTSLSKQTDTQYQITRLQGQIQYDDYQIQEKEKEIAMLEKENAEIDTRIETLQNETYPTEGEAKEAQSLISRADSTRIANMDTIAQKQEEIAELQMRSENIQTQISELNVQ